MKEQKDPGLLIIIITCILCVCSIIFLGITTLKQVRSTRASADAVSDIAKQQQEELEDTLDHLKELQNGLQEIIDSQEARRAQASPVPPETPVPTEKPESTPVPQPTPTPQPAHKVAIDPGHQGSWVDMSALEPNGPGSSEMKARCSTGTTGSYTGLPEYQLNLDVSLKLQKILTDRGYEVFMTRTTNDANISNAERAQQASQSGAEIYVRIHANGEESHTASGALSMCPTLSNPYVAGIAEESYLLAQTLLDTYCAGTGFANLGVQGTDSMTGINWSSIPVVILEMGFMTNENDDYQMADSSFQDIMARAIADGIDDYFSQT